MNGSLSPLPPVTLVLIFALVASTHEDVAFAGARSVSAWTDKINSKVRLVSAAVDANGKRELLAGVQLRMSPGWKTYWKNPGDSGVPPAFDWSESKNLKAAEVLYPAPHRFADAGGTAIGYEGEVVFPVRLTPERDGEPIELRLNFSYGLCKDLCIPNEVALELKVEEGTGKAETLLLETFLAQVPKPPAPNLLPRVVDARFKSGGGTPELIVDAAFPPDAAASDLFVYAGDSFISVPSPIGPPVDGTQRFVLSFASPAEVDALKGKTLALTLVSDLGSTETLWKAE